MQFAKRILLFLAVNFLVIFTISIVLNLLGVKPFLRSHGIDYISLLIFCVVWGMGGAFISLGLSKVMAKWLMSVKIIDPNTTDPQERALLDQVHRLAQKSGLSTMPEVGIYESPEVNAFATGPSQRSSLVAVSSGLIRKMDEAELEGVLAHEISHIANGDMVTMTLLQGVINAFVMFLARILAYVCSGLGRNKNESSGGSYGSYIMFMYLFEIVFMILGFLIIAKFSRYREYRADAGGAKLAGKQNMIAALERLQKTVEKRDPAFDKPAFQALKISGKRKSGLLQLFATHPPLASRIERLESLSN